MNDFDKNLNDAANLVVGYSQVDRIKTLLRADMEALPQIQKMIEAKKDKFMATSYGRELIEFVEGLSQ